jgi:transcriptional regulator with XRE-family HTH domain
VVLLSIVTTMSFDSIKQLKHFLKVWRNRAGLSLRELARRSGVNHATISGLEHGRIKPPAKALEKLSKILGLSSEESNSLHEWAAALPNLKKIAGNTKGIESGIVVRALALLAGVPAKDVRCIWVQNPSDSDYDAVALLRNGKVLGFKIKADGDFVLGEAFEERDLPPVSLGTKRQVMTRPN